MSMTCYTDWKFVKTDSFTKAKGLLRYLEYREDRVNHIPRAGGPGRWIDCGLGGSWQEIMENAIALQSEKVLLRALVIRPPQEDVAQLKEMDPERWANRRELLEEVVHCVMDAEMERAGIKRPDGSKQPLDLPYSYVIHAPDDVKGTESSHAHVIAPAMDRERERPFNVYPKDVQHTRKVAEQETERLFELSRVRDRQPELEQEQEPGLEMGWGIPDRDIPFHSFHGMDY